MRLLFDCHMPNHKLPAELKASELEFHRHFASFANHPYIDAFKKLFLCSDYARRHINILKELLEKDSLNKKLDRQDYEALLSPISLELPQVQYAKALRSFRHYHLLRLYLREAVHLVDTTETLSAWSDCADAIILNCLHYCYKILEKKYGRPIGIKGNLSSLIILAMGKLGGRELNFSSDIDLIFSFSENGQTDGEQVIENHVFFRKQVQSFINILQRPTSDGFVFRVDLRLRPYGESGPLVFSLTAMETYYQEQGRDWERYAMVKARVISYLPSHREKQLEAIIKPFVYRRYIDFSVIESLRSMKSLIEREIRLNPALDDIKRGKGGIREVEFVIQSLQLIHGGRTLLLQEQNAMEALHRIKKEKLLDRGAAIRKGYLFLRKLENVLQIQNDQQTHALPQNKIRLMQVVYLMGYDTLKDFQGRLSQYQRIISQMFHSILKQTSYYEDERRILTKQLDNLWQGQFEQGMAVSLLKSLGFCEAKRCYQMIYAFRHGAKCRRLSQTARLRLDRFMPMLLLELASVEHTAEVLLRVIHLLDNIVGRSAYLALLTENPPILKELLHWFRHSPFISKLLVGQPFLLELLLERNDSWKPLSKQELSDSLSEMLSHQFDFEAAEEILRQFKLKHWLLAARAELKQQCSAVKIGRFLSDVAEVIVFESLNLACHQLSEKYPEISHIKSRFAIVAYGTFGSREMNFNSDLDLVFLHTVDENKEDLVIRLTRKIIHMLTIRSQSGVLYSVDTRLRPSGSAGLLVSHLKAFIEYQNYHAWTWEHQALLKARMISGNDSMRDKFYCLKKVILQQPRDKKSLKNEVLEMRKKIDQYQADEAIKIGAGGLLDLEFLIQFLVLASQNPQFYCFTHPNTQLLLLAKLKYINKNQFKTLKKAYQSYHAALHKEIINYKTTEKDVNHYREKIKKLSYQLYDIL